MFASSNRLCFVAEKLQMQGKREEAVSILVKAKDDEPENPRIWNLLGSLYNELGSEEAVKCYEQTINLNPKYYLAYRGLGNYYLKKKDYSMAEKYYSKAIEINPYRFGPIYKNRAVARLEAGNKQGAASDFVQYLGQCPSASDRANVEEMVKQLSKQ